MPWTPQQFDDLLQAILQDYANQSWTDPTTGAAMSGIDTSQGSLVFIRSACLASAVWGAYRHQDWIERQIHPDTADDEHMEHHAWTRGVNRRAGETSEQLLDRLLEYIRRPPAGGNAADYRKWALEVDNVGDAYVIAPGDQGVGTVDVVLFADEALTGSEIPEAALITEVHDYIDARRPVTAKYTRVLAPTLEEIAVTAVGSGTGWNPAAAAGDITAHIAAFVPDQVLYLAQLIAICINNGADNVAISAPAANTAPSAGATLRPGVINVS
ncbi:MAG: baseplate J/gp47 family protein [Desulfobacteraceae bacterium]|nr:baseplate J/gp47 family protein [Desulfobacteraceae bacterium]